MFSCVVTVDFERIRGRRNIDGKQNALYRCFHRLPTVVVCQDVVEHHANEDTPISYTANVDIQQPGSQRLGYMG